VRLRSPQELLAALAAACRVYGVPAPKDTSTTSLTALLGHSRAFDTLILAPLLRFKELDKLCQFCEQILERATDTPEGVTLYPDWNQIGAETGRTTSRNPNLQGQPKAGGFRRIFRARPGKTLICADYSQIELRVMAALSEDPEMVGAFQSGRDLHRLTASRIFRVAEDAVTAEQRSIGKRVNFGTLYGMGPRRLQEALRSEGLSFSLEEARHALDAWRATYQQAAQSIAAWGDDAWVRGVAATALGRIRRFTQEHGDEARVRREGGNHVIQGTAADLMKLAMVRVSQALPSVTPVAQVHDELVLEVPAEASQEAAAIVEQELLAAAREILGDQVPVAAEVHVGLTWHEAKEE
jgi:DNA polymerase-1